MSLMSQSVFFFSRLTDFFTFLDNRNKNYMKLERANQFFNKTITPEPMHSVIQTF